MRRLWARISACRCWFDCPCGGRGVGHGPRFCMFDLR
nr:MAG TPA: hypothetical protein [Caudoviricetes sp.]